MKNLTSSLLIAASVFCASLTTQAGTITLGTGLDREATLTDAQAGGAGSGNTSAADLTSYFGGSWTIAGDTNSTNGFSNGFLTISLLSGTWGGQPVISGTWSIAAGFFDIYADAVISMHVGNGRGDPDHFAWRITDGVTSGTWSYDRNSSNGGGLSNLQLWGSGKPSRVPDHGTTALLLGAGLISLSLLARRRR